MSIRLKVIMAITAIVLVISLLSIGVGIYFSQKHLLSTIENDMMLTARVGSRLVTAELGLIREQIQSASNHIGQSLEDKTTQEIIQSMEKQAEKYHYQSMTILDPQYSLAGNRSFLNWSDTLLDESYLQTTQARRALAGETVINSTEKSSNGYTVFNILTPLEENRILCGALTVMYFDRILSDLKIWDSGHIFVIDAEGTILSSTTLHSVLERYNYIERAKTDPEYQEVGGFFSLMVQGGSGVERYTFQGIPRISAYIPIEDSDGWSLGVVSPISEGPASKVQDTLFLSGAVVLGLGILAAFFAAGSLSKPFDRVLELRVIAESASAAKTSFLANMSHEMRTPLNAIIGFSELELEREEKLPLDVHESLEKIYSSGLTMLGIVNDILDISKIESGHLELVPVEYDTPSLINDTIMLNIVRIGSKPISFELDIEDNFPSKLFGDELRIKQILNNLLSNSFKYTKEGKVVLKIRSVRENSSVLINCTISDTGIGIRQEDMDKLFSDYNQVNVKSNRAIEGTGLGLAITKRLLEMMNGDVKVSSVYGQGSTFEVQFRQGFVSDTPLGKELADNLKKFRYAMNRRERNKQLVRAWIPYAKVLVVDDVATNLDVAKGMLKPYGMTVDCVKSGQAAINLIREETIKYHAIFMDHMMPGMDGIEAVRIIRNEINTEYAKTVPIIALTANAIVGNEEMFLKSGFQAFLTKPIDIIRMNDVINRWVRDKNYEKDLLQSQGPNAPYKGTGEENQELKRLLVENPVEGLDHKKALIRFGSADIYLVSLRSYTAHTPALLKDLRELDASTISAEKLEQYRITVHGIKGSSYGISADKVGQEAEALEKAAKEKNLDFIREQTDSFFQNAEKLIGSLQELFDLIDVRLSKEKKAAPDRDLLKRIRKAAAAYDMGELDKTMEELEQYGYETNADLVPWLREQIGKAEFEQITERLNDC